MNQPTSVRLFLAILLPDAVRAGLLTAVVPQRAALPGVRWVADGSLHLTLVFLGERSTAQVALLSGALAPVCAAQQPFELQVANVGCFPNARRPRVLWAGLAAGRDSLLQLHQAVSSALRTAELLAEAERFSPHLTLGRVPDTVSGPRRAALGQEWMALRLPTLPSIPVSQLHLMRSELRPEGARYNSLATLPLLRAGSVG